jgi:hypothetical protein
VICSTIVFMTRAEAVSFGTQMLDGPGVVAYAVIYRDGDWAVFEW